ncbi:APC family permease [Candidatus Bathyarchaeota archaeon]|nr:APC family permease [Candidatus Bathyarchaeota archaeon]
MRDKIKHLLLGPPLPTRRFMYEKLGRARGLAAFSPDALSSIAYANQEIFLGLAVAGSVGLSYSIYVALAITVLLSVLTLSYFQTVHAYPSGGGSYTVARENLGTRLGLVAAAALIIDYLLTAAVSLTAGAAAIASAFPGLWPYRVEMSLLFLSMITLLNLRGLREMGLAMAVPVYLFLAGYMPMLAYGLGFLIIHGVTPLTSAPEATQPLTLFLLLHTFSTGCTALTGIEAISNGVPAFRPPETKNAGQTLIIMASLMSMLFLGSVGLTQALAVVPMPQETILSALARRLLGTNPLYFTIQAVTMLILVMAANTSFADFPRIAALLAVDGFMPRQLANLGDRLVFTNGILLLAAGTGALIVAFRGDTHALIPLFAVGAFLAYTLSQVGMVVHWRRERGKRWRLKAALNMLGASATGITLLVVSATKFIKGAWITFLLFPILMFVFYRVHSHYQAVSSQLRLSRQLPPSARPPSSLRIVVPVAGVNRVTAYAIAYAKLMSRDVTAVYVELEPGTGQRVLKEWRRWWPDIPLVVLRSPYRSVVEPFLHYLDEVDRRHGDGQRAAVLLPEWVPAHWWQSFLHNQTARLIKEALLYRRRHYGYQRVIIDVPYHLRR